jgi:hypothetical protein
MSQRAASWMLRDLTDAHGRFDRAPDHRVVALARPAADLLPIPASVQLKEIRPNSRDYRDPTLRRPKECQPAACAGQPRSAGVTRRPRR